MHALALSLVADCFGADVAVGTLFPAQFKHAIIMCNHAVQTVCSCLCTSGPMLLAELLMRCEADHEERSVVGPPQRSQLEQPKAVRAEQVMLALSHALHMGFVLVRREEPAVVSSPTPKLKSPPRFEVHTRCSY